MLLKVIVYLKLKTMDESSCNEILGIFKPVTAGYKKLSNNCTHITRVYCVNVPILQLGDC
jgi:hypothetical protein